MLKEIMENWKKPNPFRSKIIFFEGVDKTGKTTICRRVRFEGGHTCMFFDRGFVGRWLFWIWNKENDFPLEDWSKLESVLIGTKSYAVVLLVATKEDIIARHIKAGEKPPTEQEIEMQNSLYFSRTRALGLNGVPVLQVSTSGQSEEECVRKILEWAQIITKKEDPSGQKADYPKA